MSGLLRLVSLVSPIAASADPSSFGGEANPQNLALGFGDKLFTDIMQPADMNLAASLVEAIKLDEEGSGRAWRLKGGARAKDMVPL